MGAGVHSRERRGARIDRHRLRGRHDFESGSDRRISQEDSAGSFRAARGLAPAVLFLSGAGASFITGTTLVIDGGQMAVI
jgi:NAD(P)-dependent dehydrogenase (short-subunit alcohol dehydrogenase family)